MTVSATIKKTSHIIVSHGLNDFLRDLFEYMLEVK